MSEKFLVLCGQIVGNMQAGFEVSYDWDGEVHENRKSAIAAGLASRGSDDFNIGVIRDGRLASLDWMDEPKGEEPDTLRDIEDQIGWEDPRNTFAVRQEADALHPGGDETDFEWVRRLRQHFTDSATLADAVAHARRDALAEAAGIADEMAVCSGLTIGDGFYNALRRIERRFRALADTLPEARQPETGWRVPAGWRLVPEEPSEPMWSGLARQIVMWARSARPTGHALHRDLRNCGWAIPAWLGKEIEDADYVPPKGCVAVAIYRAMVTVAPQPPAPALGSQGGEP